MFDIRRYLQIVLLFCLILQTIAVVPVFADVIYFIDGSVTVCRDKAWEDAEKIRCEFYGTIVEYDKKDVEHVLSGVDEIPDTPPKAVLEAAEKKQNGIFATSKRSPGSLAPSPKTPVQPPAPSSAKPPAQPVLEMDRSGGLLFYDPRRPKKYWVSETSRHNSLKAALSAFAQHYGQTPEWIKAHMGGSNKLAVIHQNLSEKQSASVKPAVEKKEPVETKTASPPIDFEKLSGLPFYDPRRTEKFWAWDTSRHAKLGNALDALSKQYGQSLEWVKKHMGSTNDLGEIHRNLIRAMSSNGS